MLVAALLLLLAPAVLAFGTPHDSVVVMTTQNFSTLLEDPANGLFLIKFYAPWYVAVASLFKHFNRYNKRGWGWG